MLKVIKLHKGDTAIITFIVDNLVDTEEHGPSPGHLIKLLKDDHTYIFAALLNDMVVGFALAYRFPALYGSEFMAYLYDIEVLKNQRRKGVGSLLIKTMLSHLQKDGVGEVWLGTATDNVEAQALFTATGGVRSGETFNDFTYELS